MIKNNDDRQHALACEPKAHSHQINQIILLHNKIPLNQVRKFNYKNYLNKIIIHEEKTRT